MRQLLNGVDLIRLVYRESHEEGGEPDGQGDEEPKGRHAEAQRADLRPFRREQPAELETSGPMTSGLETSGLETSGLDERVW